MAKLRVCHLTSGHSHNDSRIYEKECLSLSRAGYETHYIVPVRDGDWEKREEVVLHSVPKGSSRIHRWVNTIRGVYQKALGVNADIYHFHDPELIPVGWLLKKRAKKTVIYDAHEDTPVQILDKHYLPRKIRALISKLASIIEHLAVKQFDAVVTATPTIHRRFKSSANKSIVVSNYPLIHESSYVPQPQSRDICYIGGLSEVRGLPQMLEATKKADANLLLAGNILTRKDNERIHNERYKPYSSYLGWLNRDGIRDLLGRSRAGLVVLTPTRAYLDSYPIKLFEYMAAGIPVIASKFPVWSEIVEGNNCGICVDPMNIDEIAEAISWILRHPEESLKMGKNGRSAVLHKYNWEEEEKKLLELYRELSC